MSENHRKSLVCEKPRNTKNLLATKFSIRFVAYQDHESHYDYESKYQRTIHVRDETDKQSEKSDLASERAYLAGHKRFCKAIQRKNQVQLKG